MLRDLESLSNVEYLDIRVKIGDKIGPIDSHPSRAGVVITSGKNIEEAKYLAEKIVKQFKNYCREMKKLHLI